MRYSRRQNRGQSGDIARRASLIAMLLLVNAAAVLLLTNALTTSAVILFGVLRLAAVGVVIHIQSSSIGTGDKLAWTMLAAAAPVVGVLLYLLWGGEWPDRHLALLAVEPPADREVERRQNESSHRRLAEALPNWQRTAKMLQKRGFPVYRDTSAAYFPSGEAFFADAVRRMERAERFIFLEFSVLAEGKLWDRIQEVLVEKARSGVEICIIFDDLRSRGRMRRETLEHIRAAGVEVIAFDPVRRQAARHIFPLCDHRGLVCVDGQYAYTGSVNAADECVGLARGLGEQRDSGVLLDGAGAWGLTRQWIHMWEMLGGRLHNEHDYYRPAEERAGDGWCQPFATGPDCAPRLAEDLCLQCIANAQSYIWLTSSRFAADDSVLQALCIAADSGVDVRLCLPGVWDSRCRQLTASAHFDRLLAHGVQIYLFEPGVLHAANFVCDGQVAVVGTADMDHHSAQLRSECGVVLYDTSAIGSLIEDLASIQQRSERVERMPWSRRSRLRKSLEKVMRAFAAWL